MTKDSNADFPVRNTAARMRRYRARKRGEDWIRFDGSTAKRKPGPVAKPKPPPAPVDCRQYALNLHGPVRHVATELEKAGAKGMNVLELAATYDHPNPGDLSRVRWHHGCVTDAEATRHLIDRAIRELGSGLKEATRSPKAGNRVRLAVPFDDLRWWRGRYERL
jgi:hypothetical protein